RAEAPRHRQRCGPRTGRSTHQRARTGAHAAAALGADRPHRSRRQGGGNRSRGYWERLRWGERAASRRDESGHRPAAHRRWPARPRLQRTGDQTDTRRQHDARHGAGVRSSYGAHALSSRPSWGKPLGQAKRSLNYEMDGVTARIERIVLLAGKISGAAKIPGGFFERHTGEVRTPGPGEGVPKKRLLDPGSVVQRSSKSRYAAQERRLRSGSFDPFLSVLQSLILPGLVASASPESRRMRELKREKEPAGQSVQFRLFLRPFRSPKLLVTRPSGFKRKTPALIGRGFSLCKSDEVNRARSTCRRCSADRPR